MNTRSIKVETAGDFFRHKTHPKIRLQGQWLARLGFTPESRILVIPGAAGEVTLRVERATV